MSVLGSAFHGLVRRPSLALSKRFSRSRLYEWLDAAAARLPQSPGSVILNIGSGGEVFDVIARRAAARVVQVDIDPDRKPDIVADVCDMNMLANHSVDAVFLIEVLEHVKSPQLALDEIKRVLKPGGQLFLSTPFLLPIHDAPYDFYRYTRFGLAHLCRDYRDVKINARNDYLASVIVLMMRSVQVGGKKLQLASVAIVLTALLIYPITRLLALFYRNDVATTGYVLTANA